VVVWNWKVTPTATRMENEMLMAMGTKKNPRSWTRMQMKMQMLQRTTQGQMRMRRTWATVVMRRGLMMHWTWNR
jgi:hypothetical protein